MGQAMARLGEVVYAFWASLFLELRHRSYCIDSIARYAFLDCAISLSYQKVIHTGFGHGNHAKVRNGHN